MRFKMNSPAANRVGKGGRPPTAVHTLEKALVEKLPIDRPRQPHPLRRGIMQTLAGEPVLPILLRRIELLPPAAAWTARRRHQSFSTKRRGFIPSGFAGRRGS
jgi:hypothetical protein